MALSLPLGVFKDDKRASKAVDPRNNVVSAVFHGNIKRCTFCEPSSAQQSSSPCKPKALQLELAFHSGENGEPSQYPGGPTSSPRSYEINWGAG